ncbi:MAG: alpha-2-macroglobulin family protein, partial [Ideonella sp.]
GQVELIVEAKDATGHLGRAATSIWISGRDELWFTQDNDDRIDILAEKLQYEPGETARLQVRMPFREATALVAVEREGVMDTRVVTLRGDDPTIEVPIQAGWGPNVYVSVLALRGRIRDVPWYSLFTWGWREPINWVRAFWYEGRRYQAPTAMVDLAKPSFKFGVAALKIGIAAHELQVSVSADKPLYKVREKALVRVKVSQGGKPMAGAQVAFAAVDEGLLALRENTSWDLLGSMIHQRDWGVETSTAQSEIIGRRHYGRKAVAAGGGGGRGGVRELFDTLLIWQPRVLLDGNGEATIEVPLNDSLTSFRLVAIADAAPQKFGTGSASIRVSQDLQALAGLPLLVRDGDRFSAMLTLRNTTTKDMKVRATLQGTAQIGGANPASMPIALPALEVALPAGAASAVSWAVQVPAQAVNLAWQAEAIEQGGGQAVDRLKLNQRVVAAVPLRVTQASLQRIDGPFSMPVQAPAEALPVSGVKSGGIVAAVQPRLGGALPGIRRFFETYPYSCLEQEFSKAVGLGDRAMWASLANRLPSYLDGDGLAAYFPAQAGDAAAGDDRLTAYLISAADEAGFEIPPASRQRMLQGLQAFVTGRIERRLWAPAFARTRDLDVRKLAAIEALSRHGLALPAMLGSINLAPNTWPTAAVIDWLRILKRVDGIAERAQRNAEAQQILRSRLTFSGTTLKFSTESTDGWWWLMDSADANAARLILAVVDEPAWKDDVPRMVVGSLGRQQRGAWSTTTANLWGVLALEKFAARFEATPVSGRTEFSMAGMGGAAGAPPLVFDWSQKPTGGEVRLPWPADAGQFRAEHRGDGKPWLTVQALAAIPLTAPFNAGYGVTRSIRAIERKQEGRWSRGDVMRVRLEIDAGSDMSWVVVSDPVPAGATVLGSGLGRDSAIASRDERREGSAWLAFEERSLEAFRAYHAFLPRGKHVIEYSLRLNNPGTFQLPPTRVEAMYAPDTYGETPNVVIEVGP